MTVPVTDEVLVTEAESRVHLSVPSGKMLRFGGDEVVSFDDLMTLGSMAQVKAAGKARIEGKEYVMRDGDVVEFRVGV